MGKSLYSMILMDEVVSEIDRIALRKNISRSALVNQILAEYASLMTPEQRIGGIYQYITKQMADSRDLIPILSAKNGTLSVKSSLDYKYRPTVRYELLLYHNPDDFIGELNVIIRTQSEALLRALDEFFRLWCRLERVYLESKVGPLHYEVGDGRFIRSIALPKNRDYSGDEIGEAITAYVNMLDTLMKAYVSGGLSPAALEQRYVSYLSRGIGIL